MKEVKKCSISGIAFTLDIDAYTLLEQYLESLKAAYAATPDGDEIVADIEARIAELILSRQENTQVVEPPLVQEIISQMGTAETINETSEQPSAQELPRIPRRLYRDTQNARLGGVCAGMAHYFKIDPTWVRLIFFAPLLLLILMSPFIPALAPFLSNLFGVFLLGYFVMWFGVPAARTARQRLEMDGEPITVQTIQQKTAHHNGSHERNADVKSVIAQVIYVLGQFVLAILKVLMGVLIFGLIVLVVALLLVLWAMISGSMQYDTLTLISVCGWEVHSYHAAILLTTAMLIPLLLLIYILLCLIISRKPSGRITLIVFLLWLAILFIAGGTALREHRRYHPAGTAEAVLPDSEHKEELREWIASDTVSVIDTQPEPAAGTGGGKSDSARITIRLPQQKQVDIQLTEHSIDINFDEKRYE